MLTVSLHKRSPNSAILRCIREDGSNTWSRLHLNMEYHDLAHIAIEKSLDLKLSFFGLVAAGHDISDFELPEDQKPQALKGSSLPPESIVTEHLVNLLMIEQFNDGKLEDFIPQLHVILKENDLPFPHYLTEDRLSLTRAAYGSLITQWQLLPSGDSLQIQLLSNE